VQLTLLNGNATSTKLFVGNDLNTSGYRLEKNEMRLILLAISKIKKDVAITDKTTFVISSDEFMQAFDYDYSSARAYQCLADAASGLMRAEPIKIYNTEADLLVDTHKKYQVPYREAYWLSDGVSFNPENSTITLSFHARVINFISMLSGNFSWYELRAISKMHSTYAMRLYQLLIQYRTKGRYKSFELKELRRILDIPDDQYQAMSNFKMRVIDPAVREINLHSDITIKNPNSKSERDEFYEQKRTSGQTISHLCFHYKFKSEEGDANVIEAVAVEKEKKPKRVSAKKKEEEKRVEEFVQGSAASALTADERKELWTFKSKYPEFSTDYILKFMLDSQVTLSAALATLEAEWKPAAEFDLAFSK
jgi:plasmid replication initiation protein